MTRTSFAVCSLSACLVLALAACATKQGASESASAASSASASQSDGAASATASASNAATGSGLDSAIAGSWRTPAYVARDQYRHPQQTLDFFHVAPNSIVIEITPGAGWYTEILSPYLRENGQYIAAVWDDAIPKQPKYRYDLNKQLRAKVAAGPDQYSRTVLRTFDPMHPSFGPANSADVVLTFRNAHNWVEEGNPQAYFDGFFAVLKPGGTLGVVDHRAKPGTDLEKQKQSGYLTEELVIGFAQKAGFRLEEKSEVNANPADTTDHPNGVWTLPPTNQHDAKDDAMYKAIGESDRMTLRFVKPAG
jgi:predicted methyltransferase